MLIRPLATRELLRECRRGTHFVGRVLLVLVVSGIACVQWLTLSATVGRLSAQAAAARAGTRLFTTWAVLQFLAVCVFTTLRSASLADERRIGSLQLARTTALGDGGIILGWFASAMGRSLLTVLLAVPVLAMSRSFGGFTANQVMAVIAVTVLAAAFASSLTLMLASRSTSAGGVVMASGMVQVFWLACSTRTFQRMLDFRWMRDLFKEAAWLNSGSLLAVYSRHGPTWVHPQDYFDAQGAGTFGLCVAVRLLGVVLLLALATINLRWPALKFTRRVKGFLTGVEKFFLSLSEGKLVIWRPKLGACTGNPILWRERAVSIVSRKDHVARIAYLSAIAVIGVAVVFGLFIEADLAAAVVIVGLVSIPCLLIFLTTIVPPATAFSKERREKTLPLLAVTPLTAEEIVRGKYGFAMRRLVVPMGIVLLIAVAMEYASHGDNREPIVVLLCGVSLVPLAVALVFYVCASAGNSAKAIAAALAVLLLSAMVMAPVLTGDVRNVLRGSLRVVCPPVTVFALGVGLLVRRHRWMANGVLLAISTGALIAFTFGFCGVAGKGREIVSGVIAAMLFIACVTRGIYVGSRWTAWYVILAPVAAALAFADWRLAFLGAFASIGFMALRSFPHASPGVGSRSVLALGLVTGLGGTHASLCAFLRRYDNYDYMKHFSTFVLFAAVVAGLTWCVLQAMRAQLDTLIGRNG